jgi:Coenzyme PQQ synthesis protein D (PqqD)
MSIPFSLRLTQSPDVLISLHGREAVLLNLKTEQYFGLNETGTCMWTALMEAEAIEGAFERLLAQYDIAPNVFRSDLERFVEQLIERGLARIDGA